MLFRRRFLFFVFCRCLSKLLFQVCSCAVNRKRNKVQIIGVTHSFSCFTTNQPREQRIGTDDWPSSTNLHILGKVPEDIIDCLKQKSAKLTGCSLLLISLFLLQAFLQPTMDKQKHILLTFIQPSSHHHSHVGC